MPHYRSTTWIRPENDATELSIRQVSLLVLVTRCAVAIIKVTPTPVHAKEITSAREESFFAL
jgi:hypothetical protein